MTRLGEQQAVLQRQLGTVATCDQLTGLASRSQLFASLSTALSAGQRGVLMLVNLDGFREVNDELGHARGDDVLRAVAERLSAAVRDGEMVARLGGDEFGVFLPDVRVLHVQPLLDRVLVASTTRLAMGGRDRHLRASVGVVFTGPGTDPTTVLGKADLAMRSGKADGGHRVSSYADVMGRDLAERRSLEADLAQAIERGQLHAVYQPLVDLSDGTLIGFEALLRWTHPQRGTIGPDVFIPVAESSGLIDEIGEWILKQALAQLRNWQLDGNPALSMAVNLSTRQLNDPKLPARVRDLVYRAGVDPATLTLEITESLAMDEGTPALARLWELKSIGVRLALDDFGTGHSSLARLALIPIDKVKIDKSFVSPLRHGDAESQRRAVLLRAAVAMSHGLGLRVVAEGAESAEHVGLLRALGCHEVQGYHLGRPAAAADLYLPGMRWSLPAPDRRLLVAGTEMSDGSHRTPTVAPRTPRVTGKAPAPDVENRQSYPSFRPGP